jgi:hypothetical protein
MKEQLYHIYAEPTDGGGQRYLGSFALENDKMHVIEDHIGAVESLVRDLAPQGEPLGAKGHALLESRFARNPYVRLYAQGDIDTGKHPHLIPEVKLGDKPANSSANVFEQPNRPDSVFQYQDQRMSKPAELRFDRGRIFLNRAALSQEEVKAVLSSLQGGTATLRYAHPSTETQIQKAEKSFESLVKAEATPTMHPRALEAHVNPKIGTQFAYKNHTPEGGIHVYVNLHDIGHVKKAHGYPAASGMVRAAAQTLVDHAKGGKVFHVRGDRFAVHMPDTVKAFEFVRNVTDALKELPPVGGTHRHSASMGMGHDAVAAALSGASANKMRALARYEPGQAQTHVHSLIHGLEGHVPVGEPPAPMA